MPGYVLLSIDAAKEAIQKIVKMYREEHKAINAEREAQLALLEQAPSEADEILKDLKTPAQMPSKKDRERNNNFTKLEAKGFLNGTLVAVMRTIAATYKVRSATNSRLYALILEELKLTPAQLNDEQVDKLLNQCFHTYNDRMVDKQEALAKQLQEAKAAAEEAEAEDAAAKAKLVATEQEKTRVVTDEVKKQLSITARLLSYFRASDSAAPAAVVASIADVGADAPAAPTETSAQTETPQITTSTLSFLEAAKKGLEAEQAREAEEAREAESARVIRVR